MAITGEAIFHFKSKFSQKGGRIDFMVSQSSTHEGRNVDVPFKESLISENINIKNSPPTHVLIFQILKGGIFVYIKYM